MEGVSVPIKPGLLHLRVRDSATPYRRMVVGNVAALMALAHGMSELCLWRVACEL